MRSCSDNSGRCGERKVTRVGTTRQLLKALKNVLGSNVTCLVGKHISVMHAQVRTRGYHANPCQSMPMQYHVHNVNRQNCPTHPCSPVMPWVLFWSDMRFLCKAVVTERFIFTFSDALCFRTL